MSHLPPFPEQWLNDIIQSVVRGSPTKTVFQLTIDVRDATKKQGVGDKFERPYKKLVHAKIVDSLARLNKSEKRKQPASASKLHPSARQPTSYGLKDFVQSREATEKFARVTNPFEARQALRSFIEVRERVELLLQDFEKGASRVPAVEFFERIEEDLAELKKCAMNEVQLHAHDRLSIAFQTLKKNGPTFAPQTPLMTVHWHILKPSENSWHVIESHYQRLAARKPLEYDLHRLEFLHRFNPGEIYVGTESFEGYVVMCFPGADLAVLECPYHGNALYFMKRSEWKSLSQLSKTELLHEHQSQVKRLLHGDGWETALKKSLRRHGLNC
jgi:hypothetical protein